MARAYRAYRSFGYGYECRTELTEVPELTEDSGTGMEVLQNSEVPGTGMELAEVPGTSNTWANTRLKGAKKTN